MMMKIDCISDLHGEEPQLPGGDLLIVAGDLTARNKISEHMRFNEWLKSQPYEKIVFIAGNHDGQLINTKPFDQENISYLRDSGTEFRGKKIWGSPWTPVFCNWHFMKKRNEIKAMFDLIPSDTDILVTHGPPYGILDKVQMSSKGDEHRLAGCKELKAAIERIQPDLHVFGHIHEGHGHQFIKGETKGTLYVNASIMDVDYNATNKPIRCYL